MLPKLETGPRQSRLIIDSQDDLPLCWFQVLICGGSAGDPPEIDGFSHHMITLARRGAGERDRAAMDRALDLLGASVSVSASRDYALISALCLERNLDAVIALVADMLARPKMDETEHHKLLRETLAVLDDLRDDDAQIAARLFNRHCVPGHPYARSVLGTAASIDRIDVEQVRARYRSLVVPENVIIGFAGAVTDERARTLAARLVADLPVTPAPPLPGAGDGSRPAGRRIVIADKPERSQSQILIGHLGPRYGTPEARDLIAVETAFGGTFSSRLMQEIRVKRGWSYGAGCSLYRSRLAHWFRMHAATAEETTPDTIALMLSMFEDLAHSGISEEEFAFAQTYLSGSLPFQMATPSQRMRIASQYQAFGLPPNYMEELPRVVAALTHDGACAAARNYLHPRDTLLVVVATADTMVPRIEALAGSETSVTVVPYEEV